MKFNGDLMTWTIICTNNAGIIKAHYVDGSNDRSSTWELACNRYGSLADPLDDFYVLTMIPGKHPVYGRNTMQSERVAELYQS